MASSMRRRDHPSFPSEITCCFLSVLKTLLMPSEPIRALSGVNVPGFPMAGFQLTLYGRIWATPEGRTSEGDPDLVGAMCYMCHNSHILVKRKMKRNKKIHLKKRAKPLFLCGYFGFHYRN